jgi:NAD(P)-dependent dehydrogenase (short-subunit alcohol dehydrogenase family)
VTELDAAAVQHAIMVTAFGGFLVARAAAQRMSKQGYDTILFTGASAKGYPRSSSFAMGKFALHGLAQSLARELQPQNIHVGDIVIDGGIANRKRTASGPDALLDPDAIADAYFALFRQHRSAWAWEVDCGPGSRRSELVAELTSSSGILILRCIMTKAWNELRLTVTAL